MKILDQHPIVYNNPNYTNVIYLKSNLDLHYHYNKSIHLINYTHCYIHILQIIIRLHKTHLFFYNPIIQSLYYFRIKDHPYIQIDINTKTYNYFQCLNLLIFDFCFSQLFFRFLISYLLIPQIKQYIAIHHLVCLHMVYVYFPTFIYIFLQISVLFYIQSLVVKIVSFIL